MWDNGHDRPTPKSIENFYALEILTEGMSSDVWFTENPKCIQVTNSEEIKFNGAKGVHVKWDKQGGGCDWVGMGIGWDGWTGKDLSMIVNKAAIQFRAYNKERRFKSLPLAAGLEDYGGKQAWIGFSGNHIKYEGESDWAIVTLPLGDFNWEEQDADPSNIKQFIIQFETAGSLYIDEMKVVPHSGSLKKRYSVLGQESVNVQIDGSADEGSWASAEKLVIDEEHEIRLLMDKEAIYVSGKIKDKTPLQNGKKGDDIWNGDAFEIALSSNPDSRPKRKIYALSDHHFGIRMNDDPMVWNWRSHSTLDKAEVKANKTDVGYTFEAKIPNSYYELENWELEKPYGFEIAIDLGDNNKREKQLRWNSEGVEGFHTNPSLWGEIIFKQIDQ